MGTYVGHPSWRVQNLFKKLPCFYFELAGCAALPGWSELKNWRNVIGLSTQKSFGTILHISQLNLFLTLCQGFLTTHSVLHRVFKNVYQVLLWLNHAIKYVYRIYTHTDRHTYIFIYLLYLGCSVWLLEIKF